MEKDLVYFGEGGLTSTSANHIANMAKEYYQTLESQLNGISLYKESVTVIGCDVKTVLQEGTNNNLEGLEEKLLKIAEAKSLIAWLREAIKAKENLSSEINRLSTKEYCKRTEQELPKEPDMPKYMSEDDYLATLSIKERNRFYELDTKCSVFGEYIHPNGAFSEQRKALKEYIQKPSRVKGGGRDTMIYTYEPTASVEDVDNAFFKLQAKHREYQAELNGMKHDMKTAIEADTIQKRTEYTAEYHTYNDKMVALNHECKDYIRKEANRIANLKIVIPNKLMGIYNTINSLGK